jgi:hypothetical protein
MPQERRTNSLALELVDNRKGHLGLSRFDNDIAPATRDNWFAVFFSHRD